MENKPFIFGVATSGDNFTDREKETERLLLNFRHGVNTVLISPRRWGKTSLVQKACRLAQSDKLKIVYLDIFSCRSDRDFTMPLHPPFSNKHLRKWTNGWSISNCFFPVSAPKSRWDRTRCLIFPYRSK